MRRVGGTFSHEFIRKLANLLRGYGASSRSQSSGGITLPKIPKPTNTPTTPGIKNVLKAPRPTRGSGASPDRAIPRPPGNPAIGK